MKKTIARDNKGRFCSNTSSALKSMSFLINTKNEHINGSNLIDFMYTFVAINKKFFENAVYILKNEPTRNYYTKLKMNESSIIFTLTFETV